MKVERYIPITTVLYKPGTVSSRERGVDDIHCILVDKFNITTVLHY